jgi:hypothetical protein
MQKSKTFKKKLQINLEANLGEEVKELNREENLEFDPILNSIKEYMEGEHKYSEDLSYKWINKDNNLKMLNKCLKSDLTNLKNFIEKRDTNCEMKVNPNFIF